MDRSRGSRPALRAPARLRSLGGLRPPAASLRCAGSRRPPWGSGSGPGAAAGPHPPRSLRSLRSLRTAVCALGPLGPFSASLRSPAAPGPLPLRGSRGGLRARARFAARVRRSAPSLRSPSPGPRGAPRLSRSGVVRPSGSAPARWPRLPLPPHPLRCGLPVRSPFLCSGSAACSAWPRRVPPSRALRASGPGCSRPGAVPGCRPAFLPPPPGVGCAAAPAALLRF